VQVVAMGCAGVPHGVVHGLLKRSSDGASQVIPDGPQVHVQRGAGAFGALNPSYTPLG
jgi:hypothetical protein